MELQNQSESEYNCVRISHIPKKILSGGHLMRHLDSILHQLFDKVGIISNVVILENAKEGFEEDDTVGFIKPRDLSKLEYLAFAFNNYYFHGK
jgi:hypothetical protein